MTAKQKEIENWKKNDVFEEVQFDNQNLMGHNNKGKNLL